MPNKIIKKYIELLLLKLFVKNQEETDDVDPLPKELAEG